MSAETLQWAGPLLQRLIAAQRLEADLVDHPRIEEVADRVMDRARELGDCLVWPVGPAAERVAGVLTVRSQGAVRVGTWNTDVRGMRLLLFAVLGVTPLMLASASEQLRRRGASEVHGCGVNILGGDEAGLASYASLRGLLPATELSFSRSAA